MFMPDKELYHTTSIMYSRIKLRFTFMALCDNVRT